MGNVKKIYVRMVTNVTGESKFELFNTPNCEGEHIMEGDLFNISDNNYEKFIEPEINISKIFSVKVIDANGCVSCVNGRLPDVTPIVIPATPRPFVPTPTPTITPTITPTLGVVTGNCYYIAVEISGLTYNDEDLYIRLRRPTDDTFIDQPYTSYKYYPGPGIIEMYFCSITPPQFRYGRSGNFIVSEKIIVNSDLATFCFTDDTCNTSGVIV